MRASGGVSSRGGATELSGSTCGARQARDLCFGWDQPDSHSAGPEIGGKTTPGAPSPCAGRVGDAPPYGESGALRPLRGFSFGGPLRRTQTSERRVREHPSIGAMDGPPVPSTANSAREVILKNIELKRGKRSLRGSPINSEGSFQHRMEHQDGLACASMPAERLIVSRLVCRHSNVHIGVNSDI